MDSFPFDKRDQVALATIPLIDYFLLYTQRTVKVSGKNGKKVYVAETRGICLPI
jgi:hypothetical protein